jgi:DNA-binding NarL/FixJ family response regulator
VKCILIVDDSPQIRHCLRALLEGNEEWSVCGEAENGLDGIDKAQLLHPDLIVLDLAMPVMNGLQAARVLRQLLPEVPIVMFTNLGSSYLRTEALAAGINSVTDKSEGVATLVGRIQQLLSAA